MLQQDRPGYTLYHGTVVHTPQLGEIEILPLMLVGVDECGTIDFVRPYGAAQHKEHRSAQAYFRAASGRDAVHFVDLTGNPWQFLFPGFVDTHIHASQYPNVGIGLELPLLEWLKDYTFSLENRFCGPDKLAFARAVYGKVLDKTLANGTTTALYFTTIDADTTNLFADLAAAKGQRAFVGKVCMDCNPEFPVYEELYDECVALMDKVIAHCAHLRSGGAHVTPIVTPRFAPACLRRLLKTLGELAETHGLPIQTHISENKDEIALVGEMFPECGSYAAVYDRHQLLGPATILAHAVHLSADECALLRSKNCSISHCPLSNTFITSGEAPVRRYLYDEKINVALGTDLSGGYEQLVLGVARLAILVSHHLQMDSAAECKVSMADALWMATMGGAKACSLDAEIGTFTEGKRFDAQLVDLNAHGSNVDVFPFQQPVVGEPDYEKKLLQLLHKWVFSGDDRNCKAVWCNGRTVVDKEDQWVYVK